MDNKMIEEIAETRRQIEVLRSLMTEENIKNLKFVGCLMFLNWMVFGLIGVYACVCWLF